MILKIFASPIKKFPIKNNAGIFENQSDYNVQFDGGSFISRFKVGDEFSYVESNEPLREPEISGLCIVSEMFYEIAQKYQADLDEFLKKFQL